MQISKNTVWLSSLLPYLHTLEPFNLACYQQCFNKMLDFRNCNLILFCLIRHKLQRDTMPFDKNVFLFIFIAVGGGCKYLETEIAFLRETLMIQMSGEKTEIVEIWDIHFNVFIWIGIAVIIIGLKHRKDCVTVTHGRIYRHWVSKTGNQSMWQGCCLCLWCRGAMTVWYGHNIVALHKQFCLTPHDSIDTIVPKT